ncbi:MAG: hypothetical protein J5966_09195, partial [Lachnospiraceae bacterium]|nr:hypothetical protein [Lachnospiraceae bacterium]
MELRGYAAFEFWGGVFCLVGGLSLVLSGTEKGEKGRRYSVFLESAGGLMLIADALAEFFGGGPGGASGIIVRAANFVSFIGSYWLPVLLLLYICACFDSD